MLNVTYLKKSSRQSALGQHEEANENKFFKFVHDGATLINKDKYYDFIMQFADAKFRQNNVIGLLFRKPSSHEAEKLAELAEEKYTECFDLELNDVFSSHVQGLATSEESKELNEEKVECDTHQGDEVCISAVAHSSCLDFTTLALRPCWFYYYSCKAIINNSQKEMTSWKKFIA